MNKNNIYRNAVVTVIAMIMFLSTITIAGTTNNYAKQPTQTVDILYTQTETSLGNTIFSEGFEDGIMPPSGWTRIVNNETWSAVTNNPHSGTYCAQCLCDTEFDSQDEWLITPALNFSNNYNYNQIFLSFWWYMSYYWGVYPYDNYDLNVYISNDSGASWEILWNEDSVGVFDNWFWCDTSMGVHIDLSEYMGDTHILIAFQYNGTNGAQLNLDDILIYSKGDPLSVEIGGPYNAYVSEDIRFEAVVAGGVSPYTYSWDFGDGNTSDNLNPMHSYSAVGVYTVGLTVEDTISNVVYDNTTATITDMSKVPELNVRSITGLSGIKAVISNDGDEDAINVNWTICIKGGMFDRIDEVTQDNFSELAVNKSETIQCETFFGIGRIDIEVTVEASNAARVTKKVSAFAFEYFVLNIQ